MRQYDVGLQHPKGSDGMTKEIFVEGIEAQADMMYRVAISILRNEEDCRDALQDAVLKAWEKRETLKNENSFRPWLTRIVINNCNTMLRAAPRSRTEGCTTYAARVSSAAAGASLFGGHELCRGRASPAHPRQYGS